MNKEELVEQAEGKVKESGFWIAADFDEHELSLGWIESEKMLVGMERCLSCGKRKVDNIADGG